MKLRWYQEESVTSIFEYFSSASGNPVIALPTGTGKSLVICELLKRIIGMWPNQRFLVMTHVKELLEQSYNTLNKIWLNAPAGIYSAGLKQKDIAQPIIFGGVASVAKVAEAFGHRDLIIIDECHLLSPKEDSMYQNVINRLKVINPYLKVIGLSATPFRLGQGMITDDGLFSDICYDLTGVNAFNRLIAEGFLSPLIPKRTNIKLDISGIGLANGDFIQSQLQCAVDKQEITQKALKEIIEYGYNRRAWLIFASGVEHSEHVAAMLNLFGIPAAAVHSKSKDRDKSIADFKAGKLRAIVNNNVLTTGFDHPPIDLIGVLRPTMSPGLWVQMLGRGTRISPETNKENCLVLDFAANTRRLGPINDPVKPRRKGQKTGEVPIKICDHCGAYNHASVRTCCNCGMEFVFKNKLLAHAGTEELIKDQLPVVDYYDVSHVVYQRHTKANSPPSIKVTYYCGKFVRFNEWVCLEHPGITGKHARDWWRQRHSAEPPESTDEALWYINNSEFRIPKRVRVWVNKSPFPEVLSYEW